ncbi:hypothetical protein UC8_38550 [Roseimaritima ulvae]|uniref:Uncharacterized protein n=1 Tax=Roseimaritima ulvae TaxID=980254 RepID=A0A5B9QRV1_9BACT|nr:hypothetical protein UC8_38550 [Roseimaritima ulvae]
MCIKLAQRICRAWHIHYLHYRDSFTALSIGRCAIHVVASVITQLRGAVSRLQASRFTCSLLHRLGNPINPNATPDQSFPE